MINDFCSLGIRVFFVLFIVVGCNKNTTAKIDLKPNQIDLGEIKINESKRVTFKIVNPSKNELKIYGIQPSCGCTLVSESSFSIPPKSFYNLIIDYKPLKLGNRHESVVIKSNTNPPFNDLVIKSNVVN